MFDIIKNFIYAVFLLLLWYGFQMNLETAQLKDFLALLHNDQAQCRAALLTFALTLLDSDQVNVGGPLRSSHYYASSGVGPNTTAGAGLKKSDTQETASAK